VTDGDTIRVDRGRGSEPVRYIGIDTPEPVDAFGPAATAANAALVEGREVTLELDVSETDQYGRLLRYVWIDDGGGWILVNRALLLGGVAVVTTYPPDVRYVDLFTAAQATAREEGAGLWAAATPAPTLVPFAAPPPDCHASYDPCLPIVGDLDCADVRALGKAPVRVVGPDSYRLDRDNDGIGCE
jgi:endonuclease YncB( thermonuclease family)